MPNSLIDATFCSSRPNECYVFVKGKYVVLNYEMGKRDIVSGPVHIADGFPILANTLFETRIDCAFDTKDGEVFIFSGDQCAKIQYAPNSTNARLLRGPIQIGAMFPCLKGTVFENGINAAMRSHVWEYVWLFKGDEWGTMNYQTIIFQENKVKKIYDLLPAVVGTVFESGIDAAFPSHIKSEGLFSPVYEAYIFKGQYYAHFRFKDFQFIGNIKRIRDDWPGLRSIL